MPSLLTGTAYNTRETCPECLLVSFGAISGLPLMKMGIKLMLKGFGAVILGSIQIYVQYGVAVPFLLQLGYRKAVKQFFLAFEVGFNGRKQKRLAKPSGTREEIILSTVNQIVYQCCLVYIGVAPTTHFLKTLYTDWIFHSCTVILRAKITITDLLHKI